MTRRKAFNNSVRSVFRLKKEANVQDDNGRLLFIFFRRIKVRCYCSFVARSFGFGCRFSCCMVVKMNNKLHADQGNLQALFIRFPCWRKRWKDAYTRSRSQLICSTVLVRAAAASHKCSLPSRFLLPVAGICCFGHFYLFIGSLIGWFHRLDILLELLIFSLN